ncbi:hypothetical protein E2C01_026100 [Portunus trituberculatus]|uniref:Uncharacterized protein n=1 Tax=Portunus trituberculatus TaxID=210409 RepID=A0A5B7EF59_PORTR|nr:hypothetical protein [Portunus trituberculatus]
MQERENEIRVPENVIHISRRHSPIVPESLVESRRPCSKRDRHVHEVHRIFTSRYIIHYSQARTEAADSKNMSRNLYLEGTRVPPGSGIGPTQHISGGDNEKSAR